MSTYPYYGQGHLASGQGDQQLVFDPRNPLSYEAYLVTLDEESLSREKQSKNYENWGNYLRDRERKRTPLAYEEFRAMYSLLSDHQKRNIRGLSRYKPFFPDPGNLNNSMSLPNASGVTAHAHPAQMHAAGGAETAASPATRLSSPASSHYGGSGMAQAHAGQQANPQSAPRQSQQAEQPSDVDDPKKNPHFAVGVKESDCIPPVHRANDEKHPTRYVWPKFLPPPGKLDFDTKKRCGAILRQHGATCTEAPDDWWKGNITAVTTAVAKAWLEVWRKTIDNMNTALAYRWNGAESQAWLYAVEFMAMCMAALGYKHIYYKGSPSHHFPAKSKLRGPRRLIK